MALWGLGIFGLYVRYILMMGWAGPWRLPFFCARRLLQVDGGVRYKCYAEWRGGSEAGDGAC